MRGAHAEYDDRVFRWDSPPPDGHPGAAYGCRCHAEPYPGPAATEQELEAEAIEPVYPEYYVIGAANALRAIPVVVGRIGTRLLRWQDERLFRRPEGVPGEWVRMPADKGRGVKYRDPRNVHNEVRIQKGNPNSRYPTSRKPYVRWKKDGALLDINGNHSTDLEQTHIPLEKFKFKPELFK